MARRGVIRQWLCKMAGAMIGVVVGAPMMVVSAPLRGQCSYTIEFVTLDCGSASFTAEGDMNDLAQVAGNGACGFGSAGAFTWDSPGPIQIVNPPPPVASVYVQAINDNFDIAGEAFIPDTANVAFLMTAEGEFFNLGIPKGGTFSSALGLNNLQQVVGRGGNVVTGPIHALLWDDGVVTDIGELLSGNSRAQDICDTGAVVGRIGSLETAQAFMFKEGEVTLLGPITDGYTSEANAVNSFEEIVGSGIVPIPCGFNQEFTWHAFIWYDGIMEALPVLPGMCRCNALDINDMGQIVGDCKTDLDLSPVIWQNGQVIDIYSLVPPKLNLLLDRAIAINNAGQILVPAGNYDTGEWSLAIFTPMAKIPADLSCDGLVNAVDLAAILNTWGQIDAPPTDLTFDGVVGPADLAELLANWS